MIPDLELIQQATNASDKIVCPELIDVIETSHTLIVSYGKLLSDIADKFVIVTSYRARSWLFETSAHSEESGLTGTILSDQGDSLAQIE
jgi:tetrahydromethanopterin S-methyltransferase subunit H